MIGTIEIDSNLNYSQVLNIIESIKSKYMDILGSFLWHEYKEKNNFMCKIKKQVYSLQFEDFKKGKIWEYLNGFENLNTLLSLDKRNKL